MSTDPVAKLLTLAMDEEPPFGPADEAFKMRIIFDSAFWSWRSGRCYWKRVKQYLK